MEGQQQNVYYLFPKQAYKSSCILVLVVQTGLCFFEWGNSEDVPIVYVCLMYCVHECTVPKQTEILKAYEERNHNKHSAT
jgi:hypothetical protein